MVLTKQEFMNLIKSRIGEDNSDETLKYLEDITDTYNDLEKKLNPNKKSDEEWEAELKAKDDEWREKYKARFFDGIDSPKGEEHKDEMLNPDEKKPTPEETITVDDLFSDKGDK